MTDTITILVATDNHVGINERDPIRGDDSWKTFHEIMCLAKEREVDMVLLAGDLFHENIPSRKSMYNVMRSLRMNCLGVRPCELAMLSDGSDQFDSAFDHVNYEDQDINVSIPVFSIHGNHDDPSGEGHYAALDLLAMSGFLNYFGKVPNNDNIFVKPILLQKGRTKLALYGLSNVRDERLFRTFREGHVTFYRAGTQEEDWFNMICVHQNHHAYTETSYLPEHSLPEFLDLVIWGHEHECVIQPQLNPERNFRVMQPGSSVATSLVPAEAVPKQVAIVSITGREFKSEPIRLKTVRPFVYKDLVLNQEKEAVKIAKKENHRTELTRFLIKIVEELIEQAKLEWQEAQEGVQNDDEEQDSQCPLPLIRLRVDTTAAEGMHKFEVENSQRFSNRFMGKVANTNDVLQVHVKKRSNALRPVKDADVDKEIMAKMRGLDNIQVESLVREFLEAQSLTILPQNYFGDAVRQFVDKDDRHAMEVFVNDSLSNQVKHLVKLQGDDEEDEDEERNLATQIEKFRTQLEVEFAKGNIKITRNKYRYKPKPDTWDSDFDGPWEEQPGALLRSDEDEDENEEDSIAPPPQRATRGGRGRGRGGRTAASTAGRKTTAAPKQPIARKATTRRTVFEDSDEEDDDGDIVLPDVEEPDDSQAIFIPDTSRPTKTSSRGRQAGSNTRKPPARAAASKAKQSTLNFTASQNSILGNSSRSRAESVTDDDDDDDAFEPVTTTKSTKRR